MRLSILNDSFKTNVGYYEKVLNSALYPIKLRKHKLILKSK